MWLLAKKQNKKTPQQFIYKMQNNSYNTYRYKSPN